MHIKSRFNARLFLFALAVIITLQATPQLFAQKLIIPIGKSITLPVAKVSKIIAVKEGVVEVMNVADTEVILAGVGTEPGITQIILWDSDGKHVYDVETYIEGDVVQKKFASLFAEPNVKLLVFPDSAFLQGQVATPEKQKEAEAVLQHLITDRKIVNLITIEQPGIGLEQKISEAIKIPTVKVTVIAGGNAQSSGSSSDQPTQVALATSTTNLRVVLQGTVKDQNEYIHMVEIVKGFVGSPDQVSNLVTIEDPIQVVFQAYVLQVNKNNIKDLGIEWGGSQDLAEGLTQGTLRFVENVSDVFRGDSRALGAPVPSDVNPFKMNNINRFDLIAAHVKALETKSKVKVLANPKLTVYANAAPLKLAHSGWTGEKDSTDAASAIEGDSGLAFVTVGQDILYPATQDNQGNITWAPAKADLKLMIRDLFVQDDTLKFSVFAKQDEPSFSRGTSAPPDILKRSVMTTVQIVNQETVVLGGLINQSREFSESRIPLLSQLPVLGRLFRSKSNTVRENELVILLTPQIKGRDVDLAGKAKYETVPVPRRTERLEQLHQMFQKIKSSHFPQDREN